MSLALEMTIGQRVLLAGRRILARLIDIAILASVGYFIISKLPLQELGDGGWIAGFVLILLYESEFTMRFGGTPGKLIMGLSVVSRSGDKLRGFAALRALPFAIPLLGSSITNQLASVLPARYGAALSAAMIFLSLAWGLLSPLMIIFAPSGRSYADRFGNSICLPRRTLRLLGLPRVGVELFNPQSETGIMERWGAGVMWALPIAAIIVTAWRYEPVVGTHGEFLTALRANATKYNLPVSGISMKRFDPSNEEDIAAGLLASQHATNILVLARTTVVDSTGPSSKLPFAVWQMAVALLPETIPPDRLSVELRFGADMGFVSNDESFRYDYNPHDLDEPNKRDTVRTDTNSVRQSEETR